MTETVTSALSVRGADLHARPRLAEYIRINIERAGEVWDPVTNPDGYIPMCVAENKLMWDLLEPRLADCRRLEEYSTGYNDMRGSQVFRERLAHFLGRTFFNREVDPHHLAILNGTGSVLEMLGYLIADAGDGVLVPTPSYTGFWMDLQLRDGLQVIPVHCGAEDGFALTNERLDAALLAADRPVRALLYTNPNNPLGRVDPPSEVRRIVDWGRSNGIHVIVDEIYALSVFGDAEFTSAAELYPDLGDWIHIVWAFSKDFAMSGLRTGLMYTHNEQLLEIIQGLAYFSSTSGDTQSVLGHLLADDDWVDGFIAENSRRLGDAYRRTTAALDRYGIPYFPADAAFFFLIDLRAYLDEPTWAAEDRLWRWMVDELNVNITPGSECRNLEPGLFRLVFSSTPTDAIEAGITRIAQALNTR